MRRLLRTALCWTAIACLATSVHAARISAQTAADNFVFVPTKCEDWMQICGGDIANLNTRLVRITVTLWDCQNFLSGCGDIIKDKLLEIGEPLHFNIMKRDFDKPLRFQVRWTAMFADQAPSGARPAAPPPQPPPKPKTGVVQDDYVDGNSPQARAAEQARLAQQNAAAETQRRQQATAAAQEQARLAQQAALQRAQQAEQQRRADEARKADEARQAAVAKQAQDLALANQQRREAAAAVAALQRQQQDQAQQANLAAQRARDQQQQQARAAALQRLQQIQQQYAQQQAQSLQSLGRADDADVATEQERLRNGYAADDALLRDINMEVMRAPADQLPGVLQRSIDRVGKQATQARDDGSTALKIGYNLNAVLGGIGRLMASRGQDNSATDALKRKQAAANSLSEAHKGRVEQLMAEQELLEQQLGSAQATAGTAASTAPDVVRHSDSGVPANLTSSITATNDERARARALAGRGGIACDAFPTAAAEAVRDTSPLRYAPGTARYRVEGSQRTATDVNKSVMDNTYKVRSFISATLRDAKDNLAVAFTLDSVEMFPRSPTLGLRGETFRVLVSRAGTAMPGNATESSNPIVQAFSAGFSQMLPLLPMESVEVGQVWHDTLTISPVPGQPEFRSRLVRLHRAVGWVTWEGARALQIQTTSELTSGGSMHFGTTETTEVAGSGRSVRDAFVSASGAFLGSVQRDSVLQYIRQGTQNARMPSQSWGCTRVARIQ